DLLRLTSTYFDLLRLTSTYFDLLRLTSTYFDLLRLRSVQVAQYKSLSTSRSVQVLPVHSVPHDTGKCC
ncbi:hypothetical protein PN497_24635, partial [Sphaerospermopsis kisseleviana CS-549]